MDYPLEPLGVNDYPVKVGSMLLTMVDPHRGFEHAYNRWYERDHYYAGCGRRTKTRERFRGRLLFH